MNELLLALALGASALSNFPRDAGGRISHPAIGVTIGGAPAVVVPAGERVMGFRADGSLALQFALGGDDPAAGPAAAADMDGDGRPEIAVVTTSGRLFLWSGGVVPGFPVSLGARARTGASFADVDGDGRPEVLVGDENGRVHAFKRGGGEAKGWPVSVSKRGGAEAKGLPASVAKPVTSTVSSSVVGGVRVVAFGTEDGRVHVLDDAGRERPGFPLVTKFAVTGAPVFVDFDEDGEMDLVVASQDFGVYGVNARGEPLPGFPVKAGYRLYEGVAIADLDGDGHRDVVFASADGMIHAVSATGEKLPGFPVRAGMRLFGGAVVGDLDRDGALDVAAATADGSVVAFDRKGKPLPGFPHALGAADVAASPLLYDLASDGSLSILVGVPSGALHAVRVARAGAAAASAPWPAPARDAARTGRYGPNPPTFKSLALSPAEPHLRDALQARWRDVWLDAAPGESAPAPRIQWLRNGTAVPALEGKRDLPAGTAKRGDHWRFVLTAHGGATAQSAEVVVRDTAPGTPSVALEPAVPSRSGPVRVKVVKPAADIDGDPLTYEFAWLMDGLETGITGDVFPGERLRKGALLAARVVATDGELGGPPALAQARVGDTAPGVARIAIDPAVPAANEIVRARIEAPATDPDGDSIEYHYRWKVDGEPRNVPLSASTLPPGIFRKHQKIEVEVRAFDGQLEGAPVRAEVTAKNTAPTAPRVEIRPTRPRKGEPLRATIVEPSQDVDRDPVAYRFSWKKNGEPFQPPGDPREIPGAEVTRTDRFEVVITPGDGEASGPSATGTVSVVNTPPVPPRIAIEPRHPKGGETLKLVVLEPARDVDGERVTLDIAWKLDGKSTGSFAETLPPSAFHKHEHARVVVTPRDGEGPGDAATYEVLVDDAPPTAPTVAFASERPTITQPLKVVVTAPATDPDGDELRYQYRFLRDGAPVAVDDGSEASKASPFWTSVSEVPANLLKKGQRWSVEVRANDGEMTGPLARAAVTIVNSPPPAPRLAFSPERPRRVDGIAVAIEQPPDPDGDRITYRYAWTRNGERYEAPPDQAQIPRGVPKKGQRWAVEVIASDGEAESAAVRQEVVIADTAPSPTAVAMCEGPVPSGTVPQVRIALAATDADGDPITYRHEWTVNGKPVPAASGQARLAAPALRKHDHVQVVVTPWDGDLAGTPATAECDVEDTPPTAPVAALEPAEPSASSGVSAVIRKPSADRDGDSVTYRYAWTRNGLPAPNDGATIPAGVLRHGEIWRVEVTPFDGEVEGERVVASATVRNTPPEPPSVALTPASAAAGEAIACDARTPERDADQEPITIHYRWLRNDRSEPIADGSPKLPAALVRRGEKWRCETWASDGFAESGRATAELVVRNSAPGAPKVEIEPEKPHRGDDLRCRIATASVDVDGDAVTYAYAWTRNGKPVPPGSDASRVEASRVAKGERWHCTATPSDGTASGPAAGAERTIANSPPGPAIVRLEPAAPRQGQPIRCEVVVQSEDADGDAVRYRFAWERNGTVQPFAESSQEVPSRLVKDGDRWRCTVVPTDDGQDGPPAGSEEALVAPITRDATAEAPARSGEVQPR